MAPENEPHSEGEEEEPPASPWLHPDDRLWRHPSEVRTNPPSPPAPPDGFFKRAFRSPHAGTWFVSALSGLVGAFVAIGALLATGEIGNQVAVVQKPPNSTVPATDPTKGTLLPGPIGTLGLVAPSIVGVTVNGPNGVQTGSGVIVGPTVGNQSYVVTDDSLFTTAADNTQVQVTTNWDYSTSATLVGTDPSSGFALLKAPLPLKDISAANLGSVANVQTGENVMVVGSLPEAASDNVPNFATGAINDTLCFIPPTNGASDAMYSMLVATLSLPQGSPDYGGAVVDGGGNVLGIAHYVQGAPDDVLYVAPIDTVMAQVTAMIKNGQVGSYPWLGVLQAADLSGQAAQAVGLSGGVQVEAIASGSPAAKAGIGDNDVITTLDGHALPSVGVLVEWLSNAKPGQVVMVSWWHSGHQRVAVVTLGVQPPTANAS
ncbi:MAG TPA: trypsin-like peptidase domain-containing protein [Acidimicrobiales bacterium]|nr:trypsin-like peptidase domain-containing protein [Acidimicrobiales bacterium]